MIVNAQPQKPDANFSTLDLDASTLTKKQIKLLVNLTFKYPKPIGKISNYLFLARIFNTTTRGNNSLVVNDKIV